MIKIRRVGRYECQGIYSIEMYEMWCLEWIAGYIHSDMQSFAYGVYCTECGSELEIVGPAILQEDSASDITVEVNVERRALDRMIEDVAAVHKEINEMSDKMKLIRGADSVY